MMMHDKDEMADVDALLAAAAGNRTTPVGLSARVLADADQVQPRAQRRAERRWRPSWAALLGGWQGLGGLAAATCAGFWIGISPPQVLPDPAALVLGDQDAGYAILADHSGFGWDMEEG